MPLCGSQLVWDMKLCNLEYISWGLWITNIHLIFHPFITTFLWPLNFLFLSLNGIGSFYFVMLRWVYETSLQSTLPFLSQTKKLWTFIPPLNPFIFSLSTSKLNKVEWWKFIFNLGSLYKKSRMWLTLSIASFWILISSDNKPLWDITPLEIQTIFL